MEIFNVCAMTSTYIFVNTLSFAEILHALLRKNGYKSFILFGKMTPEERDLTMNKFRTEEINVLITTNVLARGVDVP